MNELMIYGLIFAAGLIIGIIVTIVITRIYKPYYKQDILSISGEIQKNLAAFTDTSMQASVQHLVNLSEEVISKHTALGEQNLDSKKQLIDQSLKDIRENLKNVETLVNDFEKDRAEKFGQLSQQIQLASEQTLRLQETTGKLQMALGNARVRGQWGERMADDILQNIGFVEGTNYIKQQTSEETGARPDYTFLLPNNLRLNMDVKFPLDNYMKYMNAEAEADREIFRVAFMSDTRQRIKEVTGRDYINPEDNTVDYVLVLIPNEQVYRFINENDPSLLDVALKNKVVLCSPVTLYAVLALIRQALENFKMEKATNEILKLFNEFGKQWKRFVESMDKMGRKIHEAQNEFHSLSGKRRNQLEKPLNKIEDIRKERGIEEAEISEGDVILLEIPPEEKGDDAATD
ncbi:MAG: DNA recombination protein RmuC [Dehalococcoidia bacterium]|nr:DNA recombination protein RmuC [Dehalococcoidia bacterium]MDD5493587.1 DNA recombination protein RmuC [Dehalococcoidia bacterium]